MNEKRGFFGRIFAGDTPPETKPDIAVETPKRSWIERLRGGLARSANALGQNIGAIFTKRKLDAATLEEFEDTLIQADLGVEASARIAEAIGMGRYARETEES